jgi:hypothetical protein
MERSLLVGAVGLRIFLISSRHWMQSRLISMDRTREFNLLQMTLITLKSLVSLLNLMSVLFSLTPTVEKVDSLNSIFRIVTDILLRKVILRLTETLEIGTICPYGMLVICSSELSLLSVTRQLLSFMLPVQSTSSNGLISFKESYSQVCLVKSTFY